MANIMRPFSLVPVDFHDMEKELERTFRGFDIPDVRVGDWRPSVDIVEEDKQYLVKVDIPGVDPKDIEIGVDGNILTIRGEKESEHKENKGNFVRYERSKGSFYRSITLPSLINTDKISAKSKNGVLVLTVPKTEKGTGRKIKIEE